MENSFAAPSLVRTSNLRNDAHSNGTDSQHVEAGPQNEEDLDLSVVDFNIPSGRKDAELGPTILGTSLEPATDAASCYAIAPSCETYFTRTYPADLTVPISSTDETLGDETLWTTSQAFPLLPKPTLMQQLPPEDSVDFPLCRDLRLVARSTYSEHINAFEMCAATRYLGSRRSPDSKK